MVDVGGPLPGEIMVVEDSRAAGQRRRYGVGRTGVEREGAEILHDNQVGVGQGAAELPARRWIRGPHGQTREQSVDRTLTGHRVGGESEPTQGVPPFGRLDGYAVGAAEAEGEDGGGRNGVTVATPAGGRIRRPDRTIEGWPG